MERRLGMVCNALPHDYRYHCALLQVESGKFPGLLTMIMRRGKLVFLHCSGHADVEQRMPMTANTLVRLYSLSKPIVSVAAMRLYERGLFQLDEPISHHLPSFANQQVLARHCNLTLPAL